MTINATSDMFIKTGDTLNLDSGNNNITIRRTGMMEGKIYQ
jgi:hypothetical protein